MICCEECFKDIEIKDIIINAKIKGECGICYNENVYIYDTEKQNELKESFNILLDIYTPINSLPDDFPHQFLTTLEYELFSNWMIFNINNDQGLSLVKEIFKDKYKKVPELFEGYIGIFNLNDPTYLKKNSLLNIYNWDDFVEEIKTENRFHTKIMNVNLLDNFCKHTSRILDKDSIYYRTRFSDEEGIDKSDMYAPPVHKVKNGRANPIGIPCLYLSNNIHTTLFELRAGTHDYLTVGTFQAKEKINIVDFTILDQTSPFMVEDLKIYATNKNHLKQISVEIARPLRSTESDLDYLPVQYVVEFVKSRGYQGVQYKSTVNKSGYNLAIFNENLFNCIEAKVYIIKDINYNYNNIITN